MRPDEMLKKIKNGEGITVDKKEMLDLLVATTIDMSMVLDSMIILLKSIDNNIRKQNENQKTS